MNLILFIIEGARTKDQNAIRRWSDALDKIEDICTSISNNEGYPESVLLIHDGNDSPSLAHAISVAEESHLPYKIVFVEKSSEWKRIP